MTNYEKYQYLESTLSICSRCKERVPAKIILENNQIFILKNCLKDGMQKEILEEDADYYFKKRNYDKPGTACKIQTPSKKGCPFDCGICPEHEQHTCIALIEVTDKCNLGCKYCYANSEKGEFLSLEKIEKMMDFYIDSEYEKAEILQLSGGEPTLHPHIIDILKIARKKEIKYVMLNTNGIKIAEDENFVKNLADLRGGFEVYLQYDGENHEKIRGRDLTKIKNKALENLAKYKIPTTLVATIDKNINEKNIGKIIDVALSTKYVRGINFQPMAYFGRLPKNIDLKERSTLSGILREVEKQTDARMKKDDFVPLPCNVDRVAIAYFLRKKEKLIPLIKKINVEKNLNMIKNTLAFNVEDFIENESEKASCGCNCMSGLTKVISPKFAKKKSKEEKIRYIDDNYFRITVTSFVDIYNFDLKSMQKECVHIITPDLKKIPFSSFNMFYRDNY